MVFNGRPSAGCATCKSRKKKCDLKKPFCDRCIKSGKQCPGVPDSIDFFRNTFSQTNKASDALMIKQSTPSMSEQVRSTITPLLIPTDWIFNAATHYNLQCSRGPRQGQLNTWAKLLTKYYARATPNTGLYHAFNALALLKISKDMHLPQLVDMANKSYGHALRTINNTLCDQFQAVRNDVALAVFAMTTFELSPQNMNRHGRYVAHIEGMKKLLVLRGERQFTNIESLEVFRALRTQIVYDHILRGRPLTNETDASVWVSEGNYDQTSMSELCAIAPKIPKLRAYIKTFHSQSNIYDIETIVAEALQIDSALGQWYQKWKCDLDYRIDTLLSNELGVWRDQAYIFQDVSKAVLMTNYCFLRIQVLDTLLRATRVTAEHTTQPSSQLYRIEHEICHLVDTICYSLPSITGQIQCVSQDIPVEDECWTYPSHAEATWILVPIVAAAQHGLINESQRSWLRLQLVHLNVDFGLVDRDSLLEESDGKQNLTPFWNIDSPQKSGLKIPVSRPVPFEHD